MSALRNLRPVGRAAATTRRDPTTVPALPASAPVAPGPPAKVRVPRPDLCTTICLEDSVWGGAKGFQSLQKKPALPPP